MDYLRDICPDDFIVIHSTAFTGGPFHMLTIRLKKKYFGSFVWKLLHDFDFVAMVSCCIWFRVAFDSSTVMCSR